MINRFNGNEIQPDEKDSTAELLVSWLHQVCDELSTMQTKLDKVLEQTSRRNRASVLTTVVKKNLTESIVIPKVLDTPRFRVALLSWEKYRRGLRKILTERTITAQVKKMATWGERRAISAINYTIYKGWIGLREPDSGPEGLQKSVNKI